RRQPRYETTEIASWRARKLGAGLVLTEGCLSLSHYHAISSGQARLSVASQVLLRARVRVIPWQRASRRQLLTFLTEEAIACLEETVLKGQRLAILHHRKGSFRLISCKNCDHCFPCPDCALPMVPLEKTKSLACRFCGQNFPLPEKCPACGSKKIIWRGTGLHNILQSLKKAYPHLEIATVTAEEKMPSNPSAQIFLGTLALEEIMEEIAPALLLIPAADAFLNLPDYRSEERFFCLVNRCRQKMPPEATVLLQTYNPGLPLFQSLVANNDQLFYEKELQLRRQLAYPPFTTLLKIEIETRPEKKLDKQRRVLEELFSRCQMEPVYNGPGYPPVIRKHYRWKYLFKLASLENLKRLRPASEMPEVSLTFNPVEM
ncbi:MAG TPA: hypothetical protein PKW42_08520, partial [bacterium]|nr:hypothetical protein [bacterium]